VEKRAFFTNTARYAVDFFSVSDFLSRFFLIEFGEIQSSDAQKFLERWNLFSGAAYCLFGKKGDLFQESHPGLFRHA
jgi:hypothetical protein